MGTKKHARWTSKKQLRKNCGTLRKCEKLQKIAENREELRNCTKLRTIADLNETRRDGARCQTFAHRQGNSAASGGPCTAAQRHPHAPGSHSALPSLPATQHRPESETRRGGAAMGPEAISDVIRRSAVLLSRALCVLGGGDVGRGRFRRDPFVLQFGAEIPPPIFCCAIRAMSWSPGRQVKVSPTMFSRAERSLRNAHNFFFSFC